MTAQVAVFSDADPAGVATDYEATIDWGDGTPLTSGSVSLIPARGTTFQVTGTHTYDVEGNDQLTVTISDHEGGATTVAKGSVTIADAPLSAAATPPPVTATVGQPFSGAVAAFSAIFGTYAKPITDFTATINWGDGSAPTQGTLVATAIPGVYQVTGTHNYSDSGVNIGGSPSVPAETFPISVSIQDQDGTTLLITNTATVEDRAITLTGALNPASDSGLSSSDAITDVTQPNFFGTSEPFSQVSVFVQPVSGGPAVLVGQTEAGSTGAWTTSSDVLADGRYTVTAMAIDANHETTATTQILPSATQGPLTIDTVGPTVTAVRFAPRRGQIDVTFADNLSGLDQASVSAASSYVLTRLRPRRLTFRVSVLAETAPDPAGPVTVALSINPARLLRTGIDIFTILSGAGATGIRDAAGNALDGNFAGSFPSGNQISPGNFVAELDAVHHVVLARP